jgi:hypothetical protein
MPSQLVFVLLTQPLHGRSWWNIRGCPNKQMSGTSAGVGGRAACSTIILLLLLGPPVLLLAGVTFLIWFPLKKLCGSPATAGAIFESCVSFWGNVLICPIYLSLFLIVLAILSPCIILSMLCQLVVRCCRLCGNCEDVPINQEERNAVVNSEAAQLEMLRAMMQRGLQAELEASEVRRADVETGNPARMSTVKTDTVD